MTAPIDLTLGFCPGCGHSLATCSCWFDCRCGCLWAAHVDADGYAGGACEDCDCPAFVEDPQ
jgi:hypothetical protein